MAARRTYKIRISAMLTNMDSVMQILTTFLRIRISDYGFANTASL